MIHILGHQAMLRPACSSGPRAETAALAAATILRYEFGG